MNKPSNRKGRIDEQIAFIESKDVDILLLQEVRHGRDMKWAEHWRKQLAKIGLGTIEDSLDWAAELASSSVPPHDDIGHDNGHITAASQSWDLQLNDQLIRERLKSSDRSVFSTNFPEKILVSELETPRRTIELWNVRAVPGNSWGEEKIKIFETVYNRLTDTDNRTRILVGDFNTPDEELADGQAVPFGYNKDREVRQRYVNAELNILKGLGHLGMVDVFRAQHGYGGLEIEDTSWRSKRFDHIFATKSLDVSQCYYDVDGKEHSDHAPIIADFEL
ncbi:endonuclease/exonuclease/phosphatase family protein [Halogranum amylolyticum]|uniref:endonuclease/exonuclease/phosphatase family protein n=1 Tax=Halogranum amylolyticum TaxID=660520 RepID=UPI00147E20CD|nr:endonuclease/exonuclease/phosphatase family protein [Halogranum amylolyticum]